VVRLARVVARWLDRGAWRCAGCCGGTRCRAASAACAHALIFGGDLLLGLLLPEARLGDEVASVGGRDRGLVGGNWAWG
jgi:hypothetical protein